METGYIKFTELAEKLKVVQQASYRMVLQNKEGQWLLYTLVVDVFPEELQTNTPVYCYDYGFVAFIAGRIPGADIISWLLNKSGKIDGYDFQYDFQQDMTQLTVYWTQHPSYASLRLPKIAFPFTLFGLPHLSNALGFLPGILINDRCPFFPSVQHAIAQLIFETADPNQMGGSNQAFSVRFIHDEARIKHIEISPLLLSIDIDGASLTGIRCQISGPPELDFETVISQPRHVDCPLPQGMPSDVWIVLSRGTTWLDYSYISQRWSPFGRRQDNVSISPPDMRTQIQELIAQGEGLTIEFKQEIPRQNDQMLKTVAAFANSIGGAILLRVANTGDIVGVTISGDLSQEKDRIINMIRNAVYPDPPVRIEYCDMDNTDGRGRQVIAIFVDQGVSPLYGLHRDKPEVYVRRQATTFRARTEEIVAFIQAKKPGKQYL